VLPHHGTFVVWNLPALRIPVTHGLLDAPWGSFRAEREIPRANRVASLPGEAWTVGEIPLDPGDLSRAVEMTGSVPQDFSPRVQSGRPAAEPHRSRWHAGWDGISPLGRVHPYTFSTLRRSQGSAAACRGGEPPGGAAGLRTAEAAAAPGSLTLPGSSP